MLPQCKHGPKTGVANRALEVVLLRVGAEVRLVVVGVAGAIAADIAGVRVPALVLPDVPNQVGPVTVDFVADMAGQVGVAMGEDLKHKHGIGGEWHIIVSCTSTIYSPTQLGTPLSEAKGRLPILISPCRSTMNS